MTSSCALAATITWWRAPHRWYPPPSVSGPPSELPVSRNCLHHVLERIANGVPAWSTYKREENTIHRKWCCLHSKLLQLHYIHVQNVKSLQSVSQLVLSPGFPFQILSHSFGENSIFLQSCKTKFGMEYLSLRLFHGLPITCFFLSKNACTLG